jgi:hypothetical protein
MVIWKKKIPLKSGEFGPFFSMKNSLHRSKPLFSGQNLAPIKKKTIALEPNISP